MPEGKSGWDETENSWRYRVNDPGEFIKSTFRSKPITDGITLVLAKRTDNGPMETQAIVFSKDQYPDHADAIKWLDAHPDLKNPKAKGLGMSNFDFTNLSRYIVIKTGDQAPADVPDLRELEGGDFEPGVYALWSDAAGSIIAFAFEPSLFSQAQADEWVKRFTTAPQDEGGMSVMDVVRAVAGSVASVLKGDGLALAVNHHRTLSARTIGGRWMVMGGQGIALAPEAAAWDWNADKGNAIFDKGGWEMYARAHLVVDMGKSKAGESYPQVQAAYTYPVAELIDGKLSYVLGAAQAVYGNLRGAHGQGPAIPKSVQAEVLKTVKAIYKKFGKDTSAMTLDATDPITALTIDEISMKLQDALPDLFPIAKPPPDTGDSVNPTQPVNPLPWIGDFGTQGAIIMYGNKRYYAPYTIAADGSVAWGAMQVVDPTKQWVLPGGQSVALRNDAGNRQPIILYSFTSHLEAGDAAQEDDGLVWKEIIHPGKWFKTGTGRVIEITRDIVCGLYDAWKAGLPKLISVPTDYHHFETDGIVPVEANRGFVEKLKLVGDKLFGAFRMTDPEVAASIQSGGAADCSVYIQPNVIHPQTGTKFPWVLRHVLLTNDPLVQDLAPFGVSADTQDGPVIVQTYQQEVTTMAEPTTQTPTTPQPPAPPAPVQLDTQDIALLAEFKGLGMTVAQFNDQVKSMAAEREKVRAKARELEITGIVRAMEGGEAREGVTVIPSFRHYPVVIAAVEKALKEQPVALALSADDDGHTSLDAIVLAVVNAIPQEGRMALSVQPAPRGDPRPPEPEKPEDKKKRVRKMAKEAGLKLQGGE